MGTKKEREVRLLMLGLHNAGKTTILKNFNGEDVDTISLTLGFKLNIWDVGGQKSLRSYWQNYFESTDGLIWVVDSVDHQHMQDCQREALSSNAICEALELDSIHSHHWCIQSYSAVTGENLLQGTDWLPDDISSGIFTAE
uniref:ADP ribosylation factor like GTPase 2 n=1 Tax=Saimiri boliviensis boliviensis TaxID=39432 RepID=A0A2K6UGT0_SAIBB